SASSSESRASASASEMEEMDMERGEAEGEAEGEGEGEGEEEAVGLFIPEPMLCCEAEEGKVPHSLEMLYQAAQCTSAADCLLLATHVLLLETGFLPQGCEVKHGEMPSGWRAAGGVYRLQYSHPQCEGSVVQVVAVPMAQTLVLHATLKISSSEFSRKLVLKSDVFVTKAWAGGNPGVAYRDLQKLSCVFKDQLVYPLIATAREALDLPALFGLATLPPELLLRIMRLLDVHSLLKLSEVCRHLNCVTQDASLWKRLLHRDFRVNIHADTYDRDTRWKELYKKRFKQKKKQSRFRFFPFPGPMICPRPIPLPLPFLPPGIVGGEHDLRPILPRPRYDPIAPFPVPDPSIRFPFTRRLLRPGRNRAPDIRRGFI
ncbi:F-box only protein 7, partial [Silurus asotus]